MKIHPVHMMVVHFPAALLPMDFIFQIASVYFENPGLSEAGYYCLAGGVLGGWLAVLTGLYDLFTRVLKPGRPVPKVALVHAGLQVFILFTFSIILSLNYHHNQYIHHPPVWMWMIKGSLILLLGAGNYLGGELVLRHVAKET
jgi:uncharacterized membrane protein